MLEDLLANLSSRVSNVEDATHHRSPDTGTSQKAEDAIDPDTLRCNGTQDTALKLQDPTDGIGSIVFTEEEDSGFFGMYVICFDMAEF